MLKLLKANINANLILCRRNKLVMIIAIFFMFIAVTSLIPSLLLHSTALKFEIISRIIREMSTFINLFVAALGVLLVFYPLNRRCLKMVITKPCPPEVWLLAVLATALLVSITLHLLNLLIALLLFFFWHIPLQAGIFYIAVNAFMQSAIMVSVIIFLVSVFHPFIAVLLMAVVNESLFYYLLLLITAGIKTAETHIYKSLLKIGNQVAYAVYMILPIYAPYEHQLKGVYSSLRVDGPAFSYLGLTFVYACLLCTLCYAMTCFVLRHKRHT